MKNKELFETVGKAGQIFAVGFDLTDLEDGTQDAEISSYIEFNNITTNDAVKVIGDVLGKFIRDASKKDKVRKTMLRTLVAHIAKSMEIDEQEAKPKSSDDASIQKIAGTLESIKALLEVVKMVEED